MKGLNPFLKSYDLFFQGLGEAKYQDFTFLFSYYFEILLHSLAINNFALRKVLGIPFGPFVLIRLGFNRQSLFHLGKGFSSYGFCSLQHALSRLSHRRLLG